MLVVIILINNCGVKISVSDQNGDKMSFGLLYCSQKDALDKISAPPVAVKHFVRQSIGKLQ